MKVNRTPRPIGDAEAIHVWPNTYLDNPRVGIACGPLFNLISPAEARALADALHQAALTIERMSKQEAV